MTKFYGVHCVKPVGGVKVSGEFCKLSLLSCSFVALVADCA